MAFKPPAQRVAEEAAAASVVHLAPEDDLPPVCKDLWWQVVREFTGRRFLEAERTLLRQYVRTWAELLELEGLLKSPADFFETDRFGVKKISAAAQRHDVVLSRFLKLATALRLTPQSRLPPPSSGTDATSRTIRMTSAIATINGEVIDVRALLPGRTDDR